MNRMDMYSNQLSLAEKWRRYNAEKAGVSGEYKPVLQQANGGTDVQAAKNTAAVMEYMEHLAAGIGTMEQWEEELSGAESANEVAACLSQSVWRGHEKEKLAALQNIFIDKIDRLAALPIFVQSNNRGTEKTSIEYIAHTLSEYLFYAWARDAREQDTERADVLQMAQLVIDRLVQEKKLHFQAADDVEYAEQEYLLKQIRDKGSAEESIRHILYEVQDIANDEFAQYVFELLDRMPAGSITKVSAQVLSRQHATRHAEQLFKKLQDSANPAQTRVYSRVLQLMELENIGVSGNIVQYIESLSYTLKDAQGHDFTDANTAHRITRNGKIGLLDAQGALLGYFELGDLSDKQVERQATVLEITREMLFSSDDTPDYLRTQFLTEYAQFYETAFTDVGGVSLNELTLREQFWVYNFWKQAEPAQWEQVVRLEKEFGYTGMKTLIAAEVSPALVEDVLSFTVDDHIDAGEKRRLFSVYADAITVLEDTEQLVQKTLGQESNDAPQIQHQQVTREVARRSAASLQILIGKYKEQGTLDTAALELMEVSKKVGEMAAIYKAALRSGERLRFDQFQATPQLATADTLPESVKEQMKTMSDLNFSGREAIATDIRKKLDTPSSDTQFFVLTQKDDTSELVVGFFSVKELENGNIKIDDYNMSPVAQQAGIGEPLIAGFIDIQKSEGKTIVGTVVPENPAAKFYVERLGAQLTGYEFGVADAAFGRFKISIEPNPSVAVQELRALNIPEIVKNHPPQEITQDFTIDESQEIMTFLYQQTDSESVKTFAAVADHLTEEAGYVVARLVGSPEDKNQTVAVFVKEG